ncbi:MAG: class I SAM-dependent methyltransferase [Candidatus Krumholzibacteriota bacterium]
MICRICSNGKGLKVVLVQKGQYVHCPMCRCLFVDPFPGQESNLAFKGAETVERLEREDGRRRDYFIRRLVRLEQRMGGTYRGGRLLEIGCGTGILLREARQRGWLADAVELSAEMAARARANNPEANVITGDILTLEPEGQAFDAIIALDVLEHVLSPMTMVENCRELLRPGGLLLIQTPNTRSLRSRFQGAKWDMLDPDQHLNLFSPDALRVLLTTVGFEILEMTTASGTGLEKGASGWVAKAKENLLGLLDLGNALVVVAGRHG